MYFFLYSLAWLNDIENISLGWANDTETSILRTSYIGATGSVLEGVMQYDGGKTAVQAEDVGSGSDFPHTSSVATHKARGSF